MPFTRCGPPSTSASWWSRCELASLAGCHGELLCINVRLLSGLLLIATAGTVIVSSAEESARLRFVTLEFSPFVYDEGGPCRGRGPR